MSSYVTLLGAEDVRSAGNTMSSAADTINRACGGLEEALRRHELFLDDWLTRFRNALETAETSREAK